MSEGCSSLHQGSLGRPVQSLGERTTPSWVGLSVVKPVFIRLLRMKAHMDDDCGMYSLFMVPGST